MDSEALRLGSFLGRNSDMTIELQALDDDLISHGLKLSAGRLGLKPFPEGSEIVEKVSGLSLFETDLGIVSRGHRDGGDSSMVGGIDIVDHISNNGGARRIEVVAA